MFKLKIFQLHLFVFFSFVIANGQLKSPNEFLPHKIGEAFTPHYMLVDYMYHVAENNSNITINEYGRTNQKRPLLNLIISSQENIDQIEKIRLNNLFRANLPKGKSYPEVDNIAVVWLSFSVHGNEAAGSESSMPVIYALADKSNDKTQKWLENTVVIYDPSINPDGYSRYTHWQRNVAGSITNSSPDDREHVEPWPGGRVNHYLFDLNRDWAWQTQIESQQRMEVYNKWLPHVHVDFHEMGSNSPYYFAPAAAPFHDYISEWQNDFQYTIGRNHAKYFDKEGWLYFTREVYDLFYPSYGDTYPTFNGAIGMTYEQGGGPRGGRAIDMNNGEVLTLKDRVDHHYTTALSTIEVASNNADKLISEFKKFYDAPVQGRYKSYLIKGTQKNKVKELADLLDKQDIEYTWTKAGATGTGLSYQNLKEERFEIQDGDLLVSTDQPKKTLVQVLLDPDATLEDSLTYDITAWALPYAYGIEAFASAKIISAEAMNPIADEGHTDDDEFYAIVVDWNALNAAKIVSQLHQADITMRLSAIPFVIGNQNFGRNSVIITKADNKEYAEDLLSIIKEAGATAQDFKLIKTGFSESGADLGSRKMGLLKKPEVLVLSGEGTSTNSFGQAWYYFEQVVKYPLTTVNVDRLARINLDKYNILVITDGRYRFSDGQMNDLKSWIRKGGKLIAVGSANRIFAGKEGFALKQFATDGAENQDKKEREEKQLKDRFHNYEGGQRRSIVNNVPGAIFEVKMDESHPLSYGIGEKYFTLKTSSQNYEPLKGAYNVGIIPEGGQTIGFTGSVIKKKLLGSVSFATENMGRGKVVYLIDNPLFRGFWREGQLLFSNALFLVE